LKFPNSAHEDVRPTGLIPLRTGRQAFFNPTSCADVVELLVRGRFRVACRAPDLSFILIVFSVMASWRFLRAADEREIRPVVSRLWPSESRPTPSITARAFFFLDAFDINPA